MSLRDSFPGHYLPSESELQNLWQEAIFVFDANILLHIYKYSPKTREELFTSWEFVRDRIWIPYQAALEFQNNRLVVVAERKDRYDLCRKLLKERLSDLRSLLEKEFERKTQDRNPMSLQSMWSDVLAQIDFQHLTGDYEKALEHLQQKEAAHGLPDEHGRADALRDRLDAIFGENIGAPLTGDEAKRQLATAQERCVAQIPPGYCDNDKGEVKGAGDALMWLQTLEYARQKQCFIIFVTDEEKEDWCWKPNKTIWGARPELVQEMRQVANVPFILCSGTQFMKEIARLRATNEQLETQEQAEREAAIKAALAEAQAVQEEERGDRNPQASAARAFSTFDALAESAVQNQHSSTIREAKLDALQSYAPSHWAAIQALKNLELYSPYLQAVKSLREQAMQLGVGTAPTAYLEAVRNAQDYSPYLQAANIAREYFAGIQAAQLDAIEAARGFMSQQESHEEEENEQEEE